MDAKTSQFIKTIAMVVAALFLLWIAAISYTGYRILHMTYAYHECDKMVSNKTISEKQFDACYDEKSQ